MLGMGAIIPNMFGNLSYFSFQFLFLEIVVVTPIAGCCG